jgi:sulfite reductase (ferredoxin)
MVRVRAAAGALSAEQVECIADLADRFANGVLHVTTRQDIQLHGVDIANTPEIMRRLQRVGLSTRGGGGNTVRNVTACTFAGICPSEQFNVEPYVFAVTEYLIGLEESYRLPRKYKVAFSGCAADCALATVTDLGFVACWQAGQPGFQVFGGGGMGGSSRIGDLLVPFLPATEAVRAAEAGRQLFNEIGDREHRHRARLRHAARRLGAEQFRARFLETLDAVRNRGETPVLTALAQATAAETVPSTAASGPPALDNGHGCGIYRQRQEAFVAVPLFLTLGDITAADFRELGRLAGKYSAEQALHATQGQHLSIRFVEQSQVPRLAEAVDRINPALLAYRPVHAFVTCTGAATCKLGLCLSRNLTAACGKALEQAGVKNETLQQVDTRISGCPNSCGQHHIGSIGLFGGAKRSGDCMLPGYHIMIGGRRGVDTVRFGTSLGFVPAKAVPALVADLYRDYENNHYSQETFADYADRVGISHFQSLYDRYTSLPTYAQKPAFFRDWGSDQDFSLAGRSAGECGAGVVELIQQDLQQARNALAAATVPNDDGRNLLDALLATAHALAVTRGVESREAVAVLSAFEKHFVDTGLVDGEFRALLVKGRAAATAGAGLPGASAPISRLLSAVEALYHGMNEKFEFAPEAAAATGKTPPRGADTASDKGEPVAEMDLRGIPCPLSFVKAKLAVEKLPPNQSIAFCLDAGEAADNVPASFRKEGYQVQERVTDDQGQKTLVVWQKA